MLDNGTVDMLLEMKAAGRVSHIGASAHALEAMLAVMEHPAIEVVQWPFNFIECDRALQVIEKCRQKDIGFIAMKPFGGGLLQDADACIRFLMQYDSVAPDPGFESIEHLEQVIRLAEEAAPLSDTDNDNIKRIKEELGDQFCRRCGYCQPCPQGVAITTLMTVESLAKRMPPEKLFQGWVADDVRTIDKCTDCAECEPKCPYQLPIRKRIRAGADAFDEIRRSLA